MAGTGALGSSRALVVLAGLITATLTVVAAPPARATTGTLAAFAGGLGYGTATDVSQNVATVGTDGDRVLAVSGITSTSTVPPIDYLYPTIVWAVDRLTGQASVVAGHDLAFRSDNAQDVEGVYLDGPAVGTPLFAAAAAGDGQGNVYLADSAFSRIRKVTPSGQLTTIAGTGQRGFSGDGGPASQAQLDGPLGLAVARDGTLIVADAGNSRIRAIAPNGIITTIAGNGTGGSGGDGGPALQAQLSSPSQVALDPAGNIFVAERLNDRIRKIASDGTISTFARTPFPRGVAATGVDRIVVPYGASVLSIAGAGATKIIAGTPETPGFSGDGGPATAALLNDVRGLAVDRSGNILVSDSGNLRVRQISPLGTITTISGNGRPYYSGDGAQAAGARLSAPKHMTTGPYGTYFTDEGNEVIRHVDPFGTIRTISQGRPLDIAADASGILYKAEYHRVLRRNLDGTETVVAGDGTTPGSIDAVDGILATQAPMNVTAIAVDGRGDLYLADERGVPYGQGTVLIRRVSADGRIRTVAGNGADPYVFPAPALGSHIPAARDLTFGPDGSLYVLVGGIVLRINCDVMTIRPTNITDWDWLRYGPQGLAVDRAGNVFVSVGQRVYKAAPDGTTTRIAGGGTDPVVTPGRAATAVTFDGLLGSVQVDDAGDLLLANRDRILKVTGVSAGRATPGQACTTVGLGDGYNPLNPARIMDTRTGAPLGGDQTRSIPVAGLGGVPSSGATSVVLNLTVTQPSAAGYLNAFPTGFTRPTTASLTFLPGETVGKLTVAKLGANGTVSVYNSAGTSHVVVDVVGWYGPVGGSRFTSVAPSRILDTRSGGDTLGPNTSRAVPVTGVGGVPASGVSAVVFNLTATQPTATSHLTVSPTGSLRPLASSLNFGPGQTAGNLVIAKVGTGGSVDLYNAAGTTHVIADVVGWYGDTGARFTAMSPARVLDTRMAYPIEPDATIRVRVAGVGGIPATGVSAVAFNLFVTQPTATSYLIATAAGAPRPATSSLNFDPGQTVGNLVVASVGGDGQVDVFNLAGTAHFIVDVVGWYGR